MFLNMNLFNIPSWIRNFNYPYTCYEQVPEEIFDGINKDLDKIQSDVPLVSIVIAAWNEEINILKCIASLSRMQTNTPLEIIVVNNNSTDRTQDILNRLHIRTYHQSIQGSGPARQMGQENAKGKYILMGDADCLYPDCWVDEMLKVLQKPGVVCVYGRYSFINEPGYSRWKLATFELLKDIVAEFRDINRPYFNSYGISMGYIREFGLKVGFIMINRRGEDGQLCLDLMKYGKIKQVRSNKARAWTGLRTIQLDGSISEAFTIRLKKELGRFFYNLHRSLPEKEKHDKKHD